MSDTHVEVVDHTEPTVFVTVGSYAFRFQVLGEGSALTSGWPEGSKIVVRGMLQAALAMLDKENEG